MSGVGPSSINWGLKHVTTFPYMAGVCAILLSMLGLPLIAILISGLAFLLLRTQIMRDSNGFHRMLWVRRRPTAPRSCLRWQCCSGCFDLGFLWLAPLLCTTVLP